jgi:peptidoglycan/LPS O-acetylase OafA/YrhL
MKIQQLHLSHPKYRPDIDGLRAVAVLAVVVFHAFPNWVRGGFIGVDVFFVISGYLISTIIFENLDKGTFSFTEFYARRIKRIFPALLLVLIACLVFGWFTLLADEYKQLGKHTAAGAGFISNFVLWKEAGYFDNSAETKPLLHLWSLGIEEQFYIIWPFFLWLAWKSKFNLLIITIIFATVSFVLNIKGIKLDMVATFYSPQTRFWELLSGSLLAWFALYKKDTFTGIKSKIDVWLSRIVYSQKQEGDGKTLANVLSFVGLFLLLYGFWRINKQLSFPGNWALVPVLGTVLIITAGSKAWINRTILSNRVAVFFGLISFPLYLWHWPILSFARIIEIEAPSRNLRIAAILLSIALAWLSYKLVEHPLRFGNYSKVKVTVLVVLMAIAGTCGLYFFKKNGFTNEGKGYISFSDQYKKFDNIFYKCESHLVLSNSEIWEGNVRCWQSKSGKPNVILLGDSHAENLFFGLANLLKDKNVASYIRGGRPSINDVNFNFIFNELLDDNGKGKKILLITHYIGDWNNGLLIDELQTTIESLKNRGYDVALVGDIPQFSMKPSECIGLNNRKIIFRNVISDCQIDLKTFSAQKSLYDESLRRISERYDIPYVNGDAVFCNLKSCSMFDEDFKLLYIDNNHLNPEGSMRIGKVLVEELKKRSFF